MIEEHKPSVIQMIGGDPGDASVPVGAHRRGDWKLLALPLRCGGIVAGSVSVLTPEAGGFGPAEVKLLEHMVRVLGDGLSAARQRAVARHGIGQLREEEILCDERRRVAQTLHDHIGQSLQAIHLGLRRLQGESSTPSRSSREVIEQLVDESAAALEQVREISHRLAPLSLQRRDFVEAVRSHCADAEHAYATPVRFHHRGRCQAVAERVSEQCYMAFREALGNALKHAGADRIDVLLKFRDDAGMTIAVLDNGCGFELSTTTLCSDGLGLLSIQARAASVGARVRVRSRSGRGTLVRIDTWPSSSPA